MLFKLQSQTRKKWLHQPFLCHVKPHRPLKAHHTCKIWSSDQNNPRVHRLPSSAFAKSICLHGDPWIFLQHYIKNRIFTLKTPFTGLISTPTCHLSIHESPVEIMWLWDLPVNGNSWRRVRNSFHGMSLAAQEPLLARLSSPHMHSIFFAFILLQGPYIPSFAKGGMIHWPRRCYWTAIGREYRSPIGLLVFFC